MSVVPVSMTDWTYKTAYQQQTHLSSDRGEGEGPYEQVHAHPAEEESRVRLRKLEEEDWLYLLLLGDKGSENSWGLGGGDGLVTHAEETV